MKFDYVVDQNFFLTEEYVSISNSLIEDKCDLTDLGAETVEKTAIVNITRWAHAKQYLSRLENAVVGINREVFGLDLYPLVDTDTVHFNQYHALYNGKYDWHKDGEKNNLYDYKLTILVNASTDEYDGGHLELFINGPRHIKEFDTPGSVLIFPSYIEHRVTPVTQGTRKSISMWMLGPNFR